MVVDLKALKARNDYYMHVCVLAQQELWVIK